LFAALRTKNGGMLVAVEGISIDVAQVGEIASIMGTLKNELTETLETISKEIMTTNTIWDSDAESELQSRFFDIEKKVENFNSDLESYQTFLHETAKEYGYIERKLNDNASSFL
jgi:uncharacterized protein YukE